MMERRQSRERVHRRPLFSPDDATYGLALLFLSLVRLVPASQLVRVIDMVSPVLARLLQTSHLHAARKICENMAALLPAQCLPDITPVYARRLLSTIVWNALVIHSLPALPRSQIADLVKLEGAAGLRERLDSGRPVLIWGYHFGVDPFIVANVLYAHGYPLHAVTHVHQVPPTASFLQRRYFLRLHAADNALSVIDPRQGVQRKMLDILKRNECLYVTPDYMLPQNQKHVWSAFEVPVDLLGRRAFLQAGSLRLAKRLDAQVMTVFTVQGAGALRHLRIEPCQALTSGLTPDDLQRDLQMGMRRLEAQVLTHPYWWLDLKRNDLLQRLT
jgi:lauroyl/myristoyl acyltransferase